MKKELTFVAKSCYNHDNTVFDSDRYALLVINQCINHLEENGMVEAADELKSYFGVE